jgi:hypothetical protein
VTRAVRFISRRIIRKPRPKISCCGAPVSRENDFLFFDGAVDVSKVIAKRVTGIGCSLLQVTGEVQLCAQRPAGLNSFRLSPLRFPNVPGGYKQLFDIFRADEKAAVVICENDITRLHLEIAEAGMPER